MPASGRGLEKGTCRFPLPQKFPISRASHDNSSRILSFPSLGSKIPGSHVSSILKFMFLRSPNITILCFGDFEPHKGLFTRF